MTTYIPEHRLTEKEGEPIKALLEAEIFAGALGVMLRTRGKDIHIYKSNKTPIDVIDTRDYANKPESLGTVRDFLLFLAEKAK